jgi:hypothetical protein
MSTKIFPECIGSRSVRIFVMGPCPSKVEVLDEDVNEKPVRRQTDA